MRHTKSPHIALWLTMLIALSAGACKRSEPDPGDGIDEAARLLRATRFDGAYERALALLDATAGTAQIPGRANRARLLHDRALLDLFLAAWLTGRDDLYDKLKIRLGMQLDGPLIGPHNFQILAQDFLERFRAIARDAADESQVKGQAEALALFANGLQGVLFRNKRHYFEGRDAVAAFPDLAVLDDLLAVRDLTAETLERQSTPAANWQHIVLTVVGRVCSKVAARYIDMVCMGGLPGRDEEFCRTDFDALSKQRQAAGRGYLQRFCAPDSATGKEPEVVGLAAVKAHYDAALTRLQADDALPEPLQEWVTGVATRKDEAYSALQRFF